MSASLPAFQPATELGPSPTHRRCWKPWCAGRPEQLEKLQDTAELGQSPDSHILQPA